MSRILPGRLLCAVVALTTLVGCGKSEEEMAAVAADLAGVVSVRASQESGDGLPFVTQFPADVRVVMEEDAAVGEIKAVSETYRDEIEDGDVERLSIVLVGPPRATLETSGGVFAPEEMVEDLLATRAEPGLLRYRLEVAEHRHSLDLSVESGGFDELLAEVEQQMLVEARTSVTVRHGGFALSADDSRGEVDYSGAHIRLARDVWERFTLRKVIIGDRETVGLWVDRHDVNAVRRLIESRRATYAYVHPHR